MGVGLNEFNRKQTTLPVKQKEVLSVASSSVESWLIKRSTFYVLVEDIGAN